MRVDVPSAADNLNPVMSKMENPVAENNRPRFSFLIISYNTLPLTRAAITSIAKHAASLPHEVILVDNHSTDGSVAALRQEFADLRVIALEENRGFAAANNAGAKVATGDWLILMNSDAELLADTMPAIDDLLRRHPQLDVLGGQLLNPDGSAQTSVLSDYHRIRHEQRDLVEVAGIVGAFMIVRRALWQKLNGMDEGFFFYGEDLNFCQRAVAADAVLRYSPRFSVVHHGGSSSKKADLRAIIEGWESRHYLWRQEMSEPECRSNIRRCGLRFFFRVVWYFSLSLVTGFLLRAFTGRLRKYFHLLKWHWHGCPAGWGFRPVAKKSF